MPYGIPWDKPWYHGKTHGEHPMGYLMRQSMGYPSYLPRGDHGSY